MLRLISTAALAGALAIAASAPSQAAEGRKKSMLTGVAVGAVGAVAVGVVANKLMNGGQPAPAPIAEDYAPPPRATGSIHRVRAEEYERPCRMVPTKLYTRDGEYVKTERLEVCR